MEVFDLDAAIGSSKNNDSVFDLDAALASNDPGTQNRFTVNPGPMLGHVTDFMSGAWRGVKGIASMPGQFIESQAEPAYEALNAYRSGDYGTAVKQGIRAATPLLPMAEGMGQDSGNRLVEATRLAKEGQGLAAAAKAGTAIPMVGPMAEVWGEDVASGHPLRAVGEAATFALLPGAAKGAPEIAGAVRSGTVNGASMSIKAAKAAAKNPTVQMAVIGTAADLALGGPGTMGAIGGAVVRKGWRWAVEKAVEKEMGLPRSTAQVVIKEMGGIDALKAASEARIAALKAEAVAKRAAKPESPVQPYIKPQEPGSVEARLAPPVVPETVADVPRSTMPSRPIEPAPEPPVVTSAPEGAGSLSPAVLEPPAPSGMHPWAAQMVERIKGKSPEEARAILASADVKPAQVKLFMDLAEIEPSPASLPISPVSDVVTAPPAFEGQQGAPFVKGRTLPGAEDRLSYLRRTTEERGDAPAKIAEKMAENKTKGSELAAALETPEPTKPVPPTPYRPKITDTARDVNKALPSVNKAVLDRFKAMKVQALSKEAPEVFQGVKESIAAREGISGAKAELKMRQMPQEELAREVQTVYHGSPHLFEKFKLSPETIGTGEGAQAYGHGLYFAEDQSVGQAYADAMRMKSFRYEGKPVEPGSLKADAVEYLWGQQGNKVGALEDAAGNPKLQKEIRGLDWNKVDHGGIVYKAEIPKEHIDRFLDWDKPLSEQSPHVQKALSKFAPKKAEVIETNVKHPGMDEFSTFHTSDTPSVSHFGRRSAQESADLVHSERLNSFSKSGHDIYRSLADKYGQDKASLMFKKAGIPGIKYLDAGSRRAGSGTRNFVVFDDSIINTVERNGQPIKPPAEAVAKIKPSKSSIARADHAAKQAEKKANMAKRRKKEK